MAIRDAKPVRARPFWSGAGLSLLPLSALLEYSAAADDSPTLTGDWGGLRTQLLDRGINLTTIYTSELANNPRGGDEERTAYADEFAFGATFDFQRLFDWNGAHFQITVTDRNGHDLDLTANLHTLMQVQEIYGRGETWRLTEFWFQQTWFDDRLLLKVGRLAVGENFGSFSCNFQNLTFCGSQPGSVRGDYWYNYPVSQWGTRLELSFNEQVQLKFGVFQVNPTYIDDSWAAHNGLLPDNPPGTTGALIPLELDWMPKLLGLPDSFKCGVWYATSNANDVYFDANYQPLVLTGAAPLRRHGRDGAYLRFRQRWFEDGGRVAGARRRSDLAADDSTHEAEAVSAQLNSRLLLRNVDARWWCSAPDLARSCYGDLVNSPSGLRQSWNRSALDT
jgi:porin